MAIAFTPYLQFGGNAREAMEFYHSVLGGQLEVLTFGKGMPDAGDLDPEGIMHSSLFVDRGMHIMGSDAPMGGERLGTISISLSEESDADAEQLRSWWQGLSDGAAIEQPLEAAPWGGEFGMLVDRFGVRWMVNI